MEPRGNKPNNVQSASSSIANEPDAITSGSGESTSSTSPNPSLELLHAYKNSAVRQGMHWGPEAPVMVTAVLMRPLSNSSRKSMVELIIVTGKNDSRAMTTAMVEITERNGDLTMCDGRLLRSMQAKDVDSYDAPYMSSQVGISRSEVIGEYPLPIVTIQLQELNCVRALANTHGSACPADSAGTVEEGDNCIICFDELSGTDIVAKLECGHVFKPPCIVSWLFDSTCCPIC